MSDGLKHRLEFTGFKVILVEEGVLGAQAIIRCDVCSSREEAIERLKGRFDQFVSRKDALAMKKLLDVDNLCAIIKYDDGTSIYIDVEVNASLMNNDNNSKPQMTEKQMYSAMSIFSMTGNAHIRRIIAKHTVELANGQPCTIKLTYKEVDKRDDDGKYVGHDLYFVDDVSIPDWMYNDLKSVFVEE